MGLNILLADKHALFRDGMRYMLRQLDAEINLLDAGNFASMMKDVESNPHMDLVLMDLTLPGCEGMKSVGFFQQRYPNIPLVIVSESEQHNDIEQVMKSGARGFICKTSSGSSTLAALRIILCGGIYLPPQLLQRAERNLDSTAMDGCKPNIGQRVLTGRQMEVLHYLAEGLPDKVISKQMGLSSGTVKIHIAAIYRALNIHKRVEVLHVAQRLGLVSQNFG